MIKLFPHFTPLQIELRDEITRHTSLFASYSDFNFTSLYSWNTDDSSQVAWLNGNLVIKLSDYITGEQMVSLLGTTKIDASLRELLAEFSELSMVPETVIKHISNPLQFTRQEDRDNFDYIYDVQGLATMPGKAYKKKRNKLNSAVSAYGDSLTTANLHSMDDSFKAELIAVFDEWAKQPSEDNPQRDVTDTNNQTERHAFMRLLEHAEHLQLQTTVVRVDDRLVAFSIHEILPFETALCHFEKTIAEETQLYTFIASQSAKDLLEAGCKYVNWEQDLGLEGLRKAKQSYQPIGYLKKYNVKLAESS